jgi:hypothetical protein
MYTQEELRKIITILLPSYYVDYPDPDQHIIRMGVPYGSDMSDIQREAAHYPLVWSFNNLTFSLLMKKLIEDRHISISDYGVPYRFEIHLDDLIIALTCSEFCIDSFLGMLNGSTSEHTMDKLLMWRKRKMSNSKMHSKIQFINS